MGRVWIGIYHWDIGVSGNEKLSFRETGSRGCGDTCSRPHPNCSYMSARVASMKRKD